ncbi:MAG: bifunctional transaldolase/phosoglucose isomerase [Candidatus Handelsmanbacteria bacterium]|nr:bifunctional transaldolase/phosoglucose isomerase [Candidatus Handelsmanbacteria bacterium]
MANPLVELAKFGQSPWYDNIRRSLITSGELGRMIAADQLRGVTSNPAIFEKAIAGSTDYDQAVRELVAGGKSAQEIYETLAIADIQMAADLLKPVYQQTEGRDGYVSLEVSPYLARDTEGTVAEALRLHHAVARENVMIKVPATPEGLPAITRIIGQGINVNVTLIFSRQVYQQVCEAYMAGLEQLGAKGGKLEKVASVASFFVSRIDTLIDAQLSARLKASERPRERTDLQSLVGKVAIANARLAYRQYRQLVGSERWQALAAKGAKTQRLLWASTSTKNPAFRDVTYVEELIGPDTVDTIPAATWDAFRDHGRCRASLEEGVEEARDTMEMLAYVGLDMEVIGQKLVADGVWLFADAFDKLLGAVEQKRQALLGNLLDRQVFNLGAHQQGVDQTLEEWRKEGRVRRLWAGDASLWTGADEGQWLGWLHITEQQLEQVANLEELAGEIKKEGFEHILLLGMGGSSLCPEVMALTFGRVAGYPQLHVLDSTVPAQVRAFEKQIAPERTIFVVASKSGSTTEPNVFRNYFFDLMQKRVGEKAGAHFIAVTDPGSRMEIDARERGFRQICMGVPSIGGRYSALSNFGMVPAALMGLKVRDFLERTERVVHSCASCVPPRENPGVVLGIILGELARAGRDKVTIAASPGISDLGAWLEQLLAESTGKEGRGLIPVDNETLGPPAAYGQDRLFAYLRLDTAPDAGQDAAIEALEKAGHPVVRIGLADTLALGEEFFRWQIATAVAGSVLGINAFNQPNVQESKDYTRELTDQYEQSGRMPSEPPILSAEGIQLFADADNAAYLAGAAPKTRFPTGSLESYLAAHLERLQVGDYFALNAYVEMNPLHQEKLQSIRLRVRDERKVATTLGYGPRFLHSTGQLHKGGPNSGVFLQLTSADAEDLPIPGRRFSFGVLKDAQALGDFLALSKRGRRLLRVHLPAGVPAALDRLAQAVEKVLA